MKDRSICRRCHRLRPVDNTRCCDTCAEELRDMERRRPGVPVEPDPPPADDEDVMLGDGS